MSKNFIAIDKLLALQKRTKFNEDLSVNYPGIEKKEMKDKLTSLLNEVIEKFIEKVKYSGSSQEYRNLILESLNKFDLFNLDTEDKERVCLYFESIMDIIGLESSGGILNNWIYGFDPNLNSQN